MRAELRQMRRHELRVEQPVTPEPQPRHEMHQRDLAGVGDPAEHALAEKRRAERDPVKPADQLAIVPALDAVRRPAGEQRGVEAHDLLVDPGRRAGFAGLGAAPHHRLESGVATHREDAPPQYAPQAARHVQAVERQDAATFRIDPEQLRIIGRLRHRKNAGCIGLQQDFGGKADHGGGFQRRIRATGRETARASGCRNRRGGTRGRPPDAGAAGSSSRCRR